MAAKKPPVTSARRRAERASGSKKVAASTPQKRPTTTMQRPFQPGTRTSNTTGQRALPPGKKGIAGFKERYGDRAKNVMYATATKQAMKD